MIVIVNRGFCNTSARIAVFKNAKEIKSCPANQDCCKVEAREGDKFTVKLSCHGNFCMTIASVVCQDNKDEILYISPSTLLRKWSHLNYKALPGLFLLSFILEKAMGSDICNVLWAAVAALWALSLICMGFCQYSKRIVKNLYKVQVINAVTGES